MAASLTEVPLSVLAPAARLCQEFLERAITNRPGLLWYLESVAAQLTLPSQHLLLGTF
jgi:hypothetical protein